MVLPHRDVRHVHAPARVGHHGPHGLHIGGLHEEHPPHIRVLDDEGLARPLARAGTTALEALLRIGQGGLMRGGGIAQALDADLVPRGVHHLEHVGEPLFLLAQEEALAAAIGAEHQAAGGRTVDAQLVLDPGAGDIVGRAQGTVRVHADLRHHEQAEALGPGRGARRPRQHGVDDVRRQLVIAAGDEDLLPGDEVRAVALLHGLGGERAQIAAGPGLGEAHGAGPLPGVHPLAVGGLEVIAPEDLDQVGGAAGEQRLEAQGRVRPHEELADAGSHGFRKPHAAEFRTHGGADPAARSQVLEGPGKALGQLHLPVLELGADPVPHFVAGGDAAPCHLQGLVQHHAQLIPVHLFVGAGLQQGVEVEPLKEVEPDITIIIEVFHGASRRQWMSRDIMRQAALARRTYPRSHRLCPGHFSSGNCSSRNSVGEWVCSAARFRSSTRRILPEMVFGRSPNSRIRMRL